MKIDRSLAWLLVPWFSLITVFWSAAADDSKRPAPPREKRVNPAMLPIEDQAGLPRVLLIGDSISIGYTLDVRKRLQGRANVHRIPTNGGPTTNGVANLQAWLGEAKWDVIHFNFGLHDLVWYGPDGTRLVDPKTPGAHHQVPLTDYEQNLRKLVQQLKATGARLIWCHTTPVPEGAKGRVADESLIFNEAAARVMREAGVPINDLHGHALAKLKEIQLPANVHFTAEGSRYLGEKVAAEIRAALGQ
jgi:acyl-CoA thioesterase-1